MIDDEDRENESAVIQWDGNTLYSQVSYRPLESD